MTFTKLTLGEPRLRGKAHGGPVAEPCTEDLVYGTNILRDPGFETQLSHDQIPGPDGEHFPEAVGIGTPPWALEWSASTFADPVFADIGDSIGWAIDDEDANGTWVISDINPRISTNHARLPAIGAVSTFLTPIGLRMCDSIPSGRQGGEHGVWTCRVEPGDFVQFSLWGVTSNVIDFREIIMYFRIFNETMDTEVEGSSDNLTADLLTTSYAQFSHDTIVPASGHYLMAIAQVTVHGFDAVNVDLDDMALEVQP